MKIMLTNKEVYVSQLTHKTHIFYDFLIGDNEDSLLKAGRIELTDEQVAWLRSRFKEGDVVT